MHPELTEAVILAGGRSRRMGRDKAWLELRGRTLIERVLDVVGPLYGRLRLIGPSTARLRSLGVPIQPDLRPGCGALGGIHAALATATGDRVQVVACDLPFLHARLLSGLQGVLGEHDAAVPCAGDRPVPVCGLYRVSCLEAVEKSLESGVLKAARFLEAVDTRWLQGEELERLDPEGLALTNVNTREDYARAEKLVG